MLGRLKRDHLSLKYTKAEEEDKTEVIAKEIIKIETGRIIGQIAKIEDSLEIDSGLNRTTEETTSKIMLEDIEDKAAEGNMKIVVIGMMVMIEVGIDHKKDHSQEGIVVTELEVQVVLGLGQGPEPVPIEIE